jgi:NAD(P)-dependent dehydrogenase (short-subunit alcohol dehydrogenase family)
VKGLKGRVALVTGATGLLGSAIAKRLAAEGTTVAVASRSLAKANDWIEDNQSPEQKFIPVELDLSEEKSISNCLDSVLKQAAVPTIVIANASLREGVGVPFKDLDHHSFADLFNVDIAGHVLLLRESVNLLSGQSASMVFLSSIYAQAGVDHRIYPEGMLPAPVQYSAVKAAAEGTARYLAALWGERGIRVNALVPGGIASEQRQAKEFVERYSAKTMLGRMAGVDEVASAAAFLASDESSYITGHCLNVDGGLTAW